MSFGVGPSGFTTKRLADVLPEVQQLFRDVVGSNVDLANDSPFGQLAGIMADREASIWELMGLIWASAYATTAGGIALDLVFALSGMQRLDAAPSQATAHFVGAALTPIPAGTTLTASGSSRQFQTLADATVGAGGTVDVVASCTVTGPIVALASTLSLASPIAGITSATNPLDAVPGRDLEKDPAFRARRAKATATLLSASAPGMYLAVLLVANVVEARVIENASGVVDLAGRLPNSTEVVVRGGLDADILAAIWSAKPSGCPTAGSVVGTIVDAHGDAQTVRFSRPTDVPIYAKIHLATNADYPADGDAQVRLAALSYGAQLGIGKTAAPFGIEAACAGIRGIEEMEVMLGLLPGPSGQVPIQIAANARATFDSTRIEVTR